MSRPQHVTADEIERLAYEHPGAWITIHEDVAWLTFDGRTYRAHIGAPLTLGRAER